MNLASVYLTSAIKRYGEYKSLGEKTFAQLKDDDFHKQPNDTSNSIEIIIQHMHGNMLSRWTNFLTEDGEKSWRQRDDEFEAQSLSRAEIISLWDEGWKVCLNALSSLTEDHLMQTITIRSQPLLVLDAINRQLAHYSYHVGQIVYLGRWIKAGEWQSLSIPKGQSKAYNIEIDPDGQHGSTISSQFYSNK